LQTVAQKLAQVMKILQIEHSN